MSNKYDFEPSSIIDLNLGSFILPDIKDNVSCNVKVQTNDFQQYLESEEMQNPVPDKLTFRSEGKMTNLYVQYFHTVTDRREQLTDRTLCKSKLMWKSESSLPLFLILSMLSSFILEFKISNYTQPPDCNVHQQFMETEEMRNPVPDKLTLRSKGKITRLYIQYRHTVMDRKEQLTDRTLHTNKLN